MGNHIGHGDVSDGDRLVKQAANVDMVRGDGGVGDYMQVRGDA